MKRGGELPRRPAPAFEPGLRSHVGRDVAEGGVQLVAQALHRRDRCDRNQRGDQAVFDSGGASFIPQQLGQQGHTLSPITWHVLAEREIQFLIEMVEEQ